MRIWIWAGVALLGCGVARAQSTSETRQPVSQPSLIPTPVAPENPQRLRQEEQREQMLTDERRKKIVSDTERLLTLAIELKTDVEKSSKNELSLEVIKKAAEIEKLAHDVKERMRN